DEARRYLERYDVALDCERAGGSPHQRIVEFIADRGHDLLIIGAYGHSRIIEMVLGSTTEYVLRNSRCPVRSAPWPSRDSARLASDQRPCRGRQSRRGRSNTAANPSEPVYAQIAG